MQYSVRSSKYTKYAGCRPLPTAYCVLRTVYCILNVTFSPNHVTPVLSVAIKFVDDKHLKHFTMKTENKATDKLQDQKKDQPTGANSKPGAQGAAGSQGAQGSAGKVGSSQDTAFGNGSTQTGTAGAQGSQQQQGAQGRTGQQDSQGQQRDQQGAQGSGDQQGAQGSSGKSATGQRSTEDLQNQEAGIGMQDTGTDRSTLKGDAGKKGAQGSADLEDSDLESKGGVGEDNESKEIPERKSGDQLNNGKKTNGGL